MHELMRTSTKETMILGVHRGVVVLSTVGHEAGMRMEDSHLKTNPGVIWTNQAMTTGIGETSTRSENTGQPVTANHHRAAKLPRKLYKNYDTHYYN